MRLSLRLTALLLGSLALLLAVAPRAAADDTPDSWKIDRYAVTADAAADGSIAVTADLDFDFADDEGHGPYIALPLRQQIAGDPDHYRRFDVSDIEVSSGTGARTDIETETDGGALVIRVGDEDVEVTGVQNYRISYRIRGVVNPDVAGLDEINWNVIGEQWEVPMDNVSVTLTAPVPAQRVDCFTGRRYDAPCGQTPVPGASVRYAAEHLEANQPMQIVAGYPVGTFVDAAPILIPRHTVGNVLPLTPLSGGLGGAVLLGGLGALVLAVRRLGRDRRYVAATHGYAPPDPGSAGTMLAVDQPIAVAFAPPKDARPGELGTLTDERADERDVTATIVDLAVRGFLRIERIDDPEDVDADADADEAKRHYRLVKLRDDDGGLLAYESRLHRALFAAGDTPTLEELGEKGELATAVAAARRDLHADVTTHRRWFRRNPEHARLSWLGVGVGVFLLGVALALALGLTLGLGLVGVAVALVGVGFFATVSAAPARTPDGVAMLQQALGFELYLKTAEADQLRLDEGEDLFSAYLPYAIAWDCAERWAKVFADLARQGRELPAPVWFVGSQPYLWAAGADSFISDLSGFTSASSEAMTAASAGSSGASGFAGGGGVGGGGGGGW